MPEKEPADGEEIYILNERSGIKTSGLNRAAMDKFVSIDAQKLSELKADYDNALSISGLNDILLMKIESDFNIASRRIPSKTKDELREAILEFEKSNPKTGAFELIGVYEKYVRRFIKFRLS